MHATWKLSEPLRLIRNADDATAYEGGEYLSQTQIIDVWSELKSATLVAEAKSFVVILYILDESTVFYDYALWFPGLYVRLGSGPGYRKQ